MPMVDIAIPVYNEERDLEPNVRRLRAYLDARFPFSARITVVDNASTDGTWDIARALALELPSVRAQRLREKGRGRAVRHAWLGSDAAIVAYMDIDLSTDLDALLPLVAPLLSGHSDVAIGTRLAPGSRVVRGPKREAISRSYNLLLKAALGNGFSDAQCGFKAVRSDVARALLPLVEDNSWFFDTELLALAEHNGLRIHEVEVDWADDPDLFHRTGDPKLGYGALSVVMPHMQALTADGVLADIDAALDHLVRANIPPERTGVVGFCMGGTITLVTAARRDVGAVVTFYGGGVTEGRFG